MTKYFLRKVLKFSVYALIVFSAYIIQTTPGLFDFYGIKPILVLPACICIAVFEGEFAGGLFGFFAGLLCGASAFGTSNLLSTVISSNSLKTVISIAVAAIIYLFAVVLFKIIKKSDVISLPNGEKIAKVLEKFRVIG